MAVTNELAFPESDDRFEEMCFHLYRMEWKDPGCARLGGPGQKQFGLDIIGTNGARQIGVQCKHYAKKPFTLKTVEDDVKKADEASIAVDHVIFATTAASKSGLVLEVRALSEARRKAGKFTVSVSFWQELSGMLRLNKDVAREYIPGFPGGTLLQVKDAAEATLAIVKSSSERDSGFHADVSGQLEVILERISAASPASLPQSQGTEADPLIANSLDIVRGNLLQGRPKEAFELLESLGNPDRFRDTYSQFRWHTNRAAGLLLQGRKAEAASEYLAGSAIEPKLEKAWNNRAHAHLLLDNAQAALEASTEGLQAYPESAPLWALHVAARQMAGEAEPDKDVPLHIRGTPDIRFVMSNVRHKQRRHEESFDLMRLCVDADAPSLELKRHYLASALSWATVDDVAAFHDQLVPKQREALADALRRLEPLEATLAAIQIDSVSEELSSNICVALQLTRDWTRARAIAATALVRHPTLEALLRIRANELADRGDAEGLHKLTDGRLEALPSSTLAALAEVSANKGDLAWHKTVMAVLGKRENTEHQAAELRALTVHALWQAGEKAKAIELANESLKERPNHVLTRVILSRMLMQQGELLPAVQQADLAVDALGPDSPMSDVLHVADLLHERKLYPEASALYERIATSPGNNDITRRHLTSLIESCQRHRANEILEMLAPEVRGLPVFRRIESNLARQMGDWPRMRDVLKSELDRMPIDSGVALGYIGALHRMPGEKETLRAYLESDPVYDGEQPFNEVEIAKYQREHGFPSLALRRLYRLFREHPHDSALGGYFLAQVIIGTMAPELAVLPTTVVPGSAVQLRAGAEIRTIAIDFEEPGDLVSWPELLSPDSDISKRLLGMALGDKVALARGIGVVEFEIVGLTSVYAFAAEKAHTLLAETANPGGPLWSASFTKADGTPDIEPMLELARHKSARIADALKQYTSLRFPLATLAKLAGTEPLTLMLDWPSSKASLFVGIGTHEERQSAFNLLTQVGKRFVMDLPTIGELVGAGVFRRVAPLLGRPLVTRTAREELANIIQFQETAPSSPSIREEDGKYYREEATQEQLDRRLALLKEMLACMDELCEVTPVIGPKTITEHHRTLESILDSATLDAVYLALERDAALLSDDGGLRLSVPSVGLTDTLPVQPLLMLAMDQGALTHEAYVDAVMDKIARKHDFTTIRTEDLVAVVRRSPFNVAGSVAATLDTLRSPTLELQSGVQVCGEFLASIVPLCPPAVVKAYFELSLEVLQQGRPSHVEAVHRALAEGVKHGMESIPRKRAVPLRLQLGTLLDAPPPQQQRIRMTAAAIAVKEFVRRLKRLGSGTP